MNVQEWRAEIRARGGEVELKGAYGSTWVDICDSQQGLYLLRAEGWRQYSKRFGARRARLAYLCGTDDNGPFAVRIPGTASSVDEALRHITPAYVRNARAKGRKVLRQGDVWVVETTRDLADPRILPARHAWDAENRMLRHLDDERPHASLHVPFPAKFVPQTALRMGRSSRRGRAD